MLNKNNTSMFFILLTPVYLLVFICFIGMSIGSIEWLSSSFIALVSIFAAWGLSRENNIILNIIGLLSFIGLGVSFIYPILNQTERIGPWTINIYAGAALAIFGLVAFIYDVIKICRKG